jgi:hypothetical protein
MKKIILIIFAVCVFLSSSGQQYMNGKYHFTNTTIIDKLHTDSIHAGPKFDLFLDSNIIRFLFSSNHIYINSKDSITINKLKLPTSASDTVSKFKKYEGNTAQRLFNFDSLGNVNLLA